MRILTYNLWHGLDGKGVLFFGELEPWGRKQERVKIQIRCLQKWAADIVFFQELNPLFPAVYDYSSQLKTDHIQQMDLSGIKIGGFGPPFNLQSGLATLCREDWSFSRLKGLQLSGDRPMNRQFFSFQFREARYALFGEIYHPEWGRVLLVNTHLHHGCEYDPAWDCYLNQMVQEGKLKEADKRSLQRDLRRGDRRREGELKKLLEQIDQLSHDYELTILGGDFNSRPDSVVIKRVLDQGFEDAWLASGQSDPGLTWDCNQNPGNHQFNEDVQFGFQWQQKVGPLSIRQDLLEKVHKFESRPRRIDYLFFRTSHRLRVKSEVFHAKDSHRDLHGSDHFGVGMVLEKDF